MVEEALHLHRKICATNDAQAMHALIHMSDSGNEIATGLYARLLMTGWPNCLIKDKVEATRLGTRIMHCLTQGTSIGNVYAQYVLSLFFFEAIAVEKDDTEYFRLLKLAADQGLDLAQSQVGYCYNYGIGVSVNLGEGFRYYNLAAEQGYAVALYNVGFCYANGIGVAKDDTEALRYFRLASEKGSVDGHHGIGHFYEHNRGGVMPNYTDALRYYRMAADAGDANGQYGVGLIYARGNGVYVNKSIAKDRKSVV